MGVIVHGGWVCEEWPCIRFFFFNDTATTEIYTLSLHDALPIWIKRGGAAATRIGQKKSGALPQREMRSIKSGGAAATRNGQIGRAHV